jgi:peptidoglycan/LPS O-acetylase OafA/YrhL
MAALEGRRNEIQWLRAIAACEVIVCHSDLIVKHFSDQRIVLNAWYEPMVAVGVELFFIVSGYIMCMRVPASKSWRDFLASRILRIYPLYALFTTIVVIVGFIAPNWRLGGFTWDATTLARSYLILPGPGFPILEVGWTLEYEMVFYSLVTVAMILGVTRSGRMIGFAWFLAGLGCIGSALGPRPEGFAPILHILSPYMFAFGAGWLFRSIEQASWVRQTSSAMLFSALALVAAYVSPQWGDRLILRIFVAAMVFLSFLLARRVFQANNAVNRTLWLIGDGSYSIYLSHWFILSAVGKVLGALAMPAQMDWFVRILGILLSIAAGIWIFRYVEQPLGRGLRNVTFGILGRPLRGTMAGYVGPARVIAGEPKKKGSP